VNNQRIIKCPLLSCFGDYFLQMRFGQVAVDDCIVLVAAWSARRAAAFDAARYLIEELKSRAPFWKKELFADQQSRWVAGNTPPDK